MKIRNYAYIAMFAAALGLSACDDFLDKDPRNSVAGDGDVFTDIGLLRSYVNGIYLKTHYPFQQDDGFTDAMTDNSFNQHGSADNTVRTYLQGNVNKDNGESITNNLWNDSYAAIRSTNVFFQRTKDSELDADDLKQLRGENRYLRAYLYFDLMRWYGGVPLITKTYSLESSENNVPRATANEVGAFIVSQCDSAAAELISIKTSGYEQGRASIESALALKARTLLYLASPLFTGGTVDIAKWTAARDANKAVIDLPGLNLAAGQTGYTNMFLGNNSDEVILGRYFTRLTRHLGTGLGYILLPAGNNGWSVTTPTQDLVDSYELTNGLLPSDPASGYDAQNPYVNRDPRFYASILYNGAPFSGGTYDYYDVTGGDGGKDGETGANKGNASRTGYNYRKYLADNLGPNDNNISPYIIFRLSEFYLNYAEAQIALGDLGAARDAINIVRGKYNMPDVTETDADALTERYRRERRIEMVLEEQHFFDMRRWMIGADLYAKPTRNVHMIKNNDGSFTYNYGLVTTKNEVRRWSDKMNWLPIPSTEINKTGGTLSQNPLY